MLVLSGLRPLTAAAVAKGLVIGSSVGLWTRNQAKSFSYMTSDTVRRGSQTAALPA